MFRHSFNTFYSNYLCGLLLLLVPHDECATPPTTDRVQADECQALDNIITTLHENDNTRCTRDDLCTWLHCQSQIFDVDFNSSFTLLHCSEPVRARIMLNAPSVGVREWERTFKDGDSTSLPLEGMGSTKYTHSDVLITVRVKKVADPVPHETYINVSIVVAERMTVGRIPITIDEQPLLDNVQIPVSDCDDRTTSSPSSTTTTTLVPPTDTSHTQGKLCRLRALDEDVCKDGEVCRQLSASDLTWGRCHCRPSYTRDETSGQCDAPHADETTSTTTSTPSSSTTTRKGVTEGSTTSPPAQEGNTTSNSSLTAVEEKSNDSSSRTLILGITIPLSVLLVAGLAGGLLYFIYLKKRIYRRLHQNETEGGVDRAMLMTDDNDDDDDDDPLADPGALAVRA